MDIELLKTFLELCQTRHFGRASENLFVTQAAVSSRIKQLEEVLGVTLFTRTRNNIQLTSAGHRLVSHAQSVVNGWNRARQEVAAGAQMTRALAIGALPSLWAMCLSGWVSRVYRKFPEVVLNAEAQSASLLIRRVREGSLDMAFVYEAPKAGDLEVIDCVQFDLILASTVADQEFGVHDLNNYVYVDWGTAFGVMHGEEMTTLTPVLRVDMQQTALDFILQNGGAAYLAKPSIKKLIKTQHLHPVQKAPATRRSVCAVLPTASAYSDTLKTLLALLDANDA